jgi:phage terminase small subunit
MSKSAKLNKNSEGLTKRRAIFVREYLTDFNGTRSAVAAGYSENGAEVAASRLLRDVKVKAAIEAQTSERCEKLGVDADKILSELAKIGFSNMLDYLTIKDGDAYIDFSGLTREQAAAMQEVTSETYTEIGDDGKKRKIKRTRFKLADKRGSLELLGRHLKLFTDKVELGGNVSLNLDPSKRLERVAELLARAVKVGSRKTQ